MLIVISDDENGLVVTVHLEPVLDQCLYDGELDRVRVLELVNDDVVVLTRFHDGVQGIGRRVGLEQLHRFKEQQIKIQLVLRVHDALIAMVHSSCDLVQFVIVGTDGTATTHTADRGCNVPFGDGRSELVCVLDVAFCGGEDGLNALDLNLLGVHTQSERELGDGRFAEYGLQNPFRFGQNIESRGDTDAVTVFVEDGSAKGVECPAFDLTLDAGHDAHLHLVRRVLGECQSEDVIERNSLFRNEVLDPLHDDTRFASTRTGCHVDWGDGSCHCLILLVVEVAVELHGGMSSVREWNSKTK